MSIVADIEGILVSVFLSLIIGFGAGYYTESKFTKAAEVKAVVTAQKQSAIGEEKSLTVDSSINSVIAASSDAITTDRSRIASHLKTKSTATLPKENTSESHFKLTAQQSCADTGWTLDNYTVGLLNSARNSSIAYAPTGSDAAGKASSGISAAQFIDNDLQVVEQYKELATRHNALVDYVEGLIRTQAGQSAH